MKIDNNFPALANLKASRRRLENVAGRMGFCVGDGVASNADDGEYLGRIESMFLNRRNRLMLVVDGVTYGAVDCCIAPSPEEIAIRAREARELFNKRSIDRLEVVSGQLDSDHIDCWDEAGKYDE